MAGPTLAIREQCPNATPNNDGLMTADYAAKLEGLTPGGAGAIVIWSLTKTWAQVQAELAAIGNTGILLVQASNFGVSQKISGTGINLNQVLIFGIVGVQGILPVLEFLPGATLVDDSIIQSNSIAWASTDHVGNGNFAIETVIGGWSHTNASVSAFESGTSGTFFLDGGAILFAGGPAPVFHAGAGKTMFALAQNDSVFNPRSVAADAGAVVNIDMSATTQLVQPAFTGAGTFNLTFHELIYSPSNLANWSGINPGTVKNALDRIAAKIGPIL